MSERKPYTNKKHINGSSGELQVDWNTENM